MKQRKSRFSGFEKRGCSKRAQGLPISTVIIAILGLIVLAIIVMIVYQQTTKFGKGTKEVSENTCAPDNEIRPVGADCDVIYAAFKDLKAGDICCRRGTVK